MSPSFDLMQSQNPPGDPSNERKLESAVRALQELGEKRPIRDPEDAPRQEEAMRTVREFGFTNEEGSGLTGNSWSKDTFKEKTRGTEVRDHTTRADAIKLLAQMVSSGLTLADVRLAVSIKSSLDDRNVKLADLAAILQEADKSNIELYSLVSEYEQRAKLGLSLQQIKEVMSYKQELDKIGVTIDGGLKQIALAAKSHNGDVNKFIESINRIGGLPAIEKKEQELQSSIGAKEQKIKGLDDEISVKETRRSELEAPLGRLDRIFVLGFDEHTFDQIYQIATEGGRVKRSVREVVDGLAKYSTLLDLERDLSDLNIKKQNTEADIRQFEADYAHRQTLLDMCNSLLHKYKFSLQAIRDVVQVARNYGEPMAVIDALAKYGNMQTLEKDIANLEKSKSDLKVKLAELERRTGELHAKADAINEFITASINPLNVEFKRAAADLERTYHSQITLLKTEAAEYGKLLGEAKYLEESLKLARLIHLMIKVPSDAAVFPVDYAVLMLDGVIRFCIAKNVNPAVDLVKTFAHLGINMLDAVPVVNVMDVAKRTLQQYTNAV